MWQWWKELILNGLAGVALLYVAAIIYLGVRLLCLAIIGRIENERRKKARADQSVPRPPV